MSDIQRSITGARAAPYRSVRCPRRNPNYGVGKDTILNAMRALAALAFALLASTALAEEPGGLAVSARIATNVITDVVDRHSPHVAACYEAALRTEPNLQGEVVMEWVISADGRVTSVRVKRS